MEQSEPEGVDALEERRRDALAETLDAAPIDDEPLDENERAALGKRTFWRCESSPKHSQHHIYKFDNRRLTRSFGRFF